MSMKIINLGPGGCLLFLVLAQMARAASAECGEESAECSGKCPDKMGGRIFALLENESSSIKSFIDELNGKCSGIAVDNIDVVNARKMEAMKTYKRISEMTKRLGDFLIRLQKQQAEIFKLAENSGTSELLAKASSDIRTVEDRLVRMSNDKHMGLRELLEELDSLRGDIARLMEELHGMKIHDRMKNSQSAVQILISELVALQEKFEKLVGFVHQNIKFNDKIISLQNPEELEKRLVELCSGKFLKYREMILLLGAIEEQLVRYYEGHISLLDVKFAIKMEDISTFYGEILCITEKKIGMIETEIDRLKKMKEELEKKLGVPEEKRERKNAIQEKKNEITVIRSKLDLMFQSATKNISKNIKKRTESLTQNIACMVPRLTELLEDVKKLRTALVKICDRDSFIDDIFKLCEIWEAEIMAIEEILKTGFCLGIGSAPSSPSRTFDLLVLKLRYATERKSSFSSTCEEMQRLFDEIAMFLELLEKSGYFEGKADALESIKREKTLIKKAIIARRNILETQQTLSELLESAKKELGDISLNGIEELCSQLELKHEEMRLRLELADEYRFEDTALLETARVLLGKARERLGDIRDLCEKKRREKADKRRSHIVRRQRGLPNYN